MPSILEGCVWQRFWSSELYTSFTFLMSTSALANDETKLAKSTSQYSSLVEERTRKVDMGRASMLAFVLGLSLETSL